MFINGEMVSESAETYHARSEMSCSSVGEWLESPEHFKWFVVDGNKKFENDAMDFGSAFHEDMLLPVAEQTYTVIPPEVLTKDGKKSGNAWKQFEAENAGKLLVKEKEVGLFRRIRESIMAHPVARAHVESIAEGITEQTFLADLMLGDEFAIPFRGRLDVWHPAKIFDFKTTGDLSLLSMRYKPFDFLWDIRAAAYQGLVHAAGGPVLPVDFIVVEKKAPFRVEVYSPKESTIDEAKAKLVAACLEINEAYASGFWHRSGWPERVHF